MQLQWVIDSFLTCHAPEGERVVHVDIWPAPSVGAVVEGLQIVAGSSNVIAAQHLRPIEGEEDLGRNHCKVSGPQRSRRGTGWHEECAGQGLTQRRAGVVDMMQATTRHAKTTAVAMSELTAAIRLRWYGVQSVV